MKSKRNPSSIKPNMTSTVSSQSIQKAITALTHFVDKLSNKVFESEDADSESFMAAWTESQDDLAKLLKTSLVSKNKAPKDLNAPKRGKSSYILYCGDKRAEVVKKNPDMSAKEIITELGRLWRESSAKTKEQYKKLAVQDKERWANEMKNYTPPDVELSTKKAKKVKKLPGEPKRGLSSYMLFCRDERDNVKQENEGISAKDTTIELGARWRALSDSDKKRYQKLADKDKKRYAHEKAEFDKKNVTDDDQEESKVSSKPKKSSKSKVSSKPKKSSKKNGYILFCQETRSELEEDNADMSKNDITKMVNQQWKELDDDEKDEYNARALGDEVVSSF